MRFAELDRSSFVDRTVVRGSKRFFVDQSAGSWVGARVRGSEWIGAMLSLVRGSFVDRSDVLSGSWIVRGSERCAWVGALWFVDRSGSELWILGRSSFFLVRGSERCAWIGAHRDRIGLGRSTGSLDRSLLSTSMCCCARIDPVLLCVRWFSISLLSSLCVAVRGDVIRK